MTSAADITAVGLSLLDPLAPALTRYRDLEAAPACSSPRAMMW